MVYTYGKRLRKARTTVVNLTSVFVLLASSMSAAIPLMFAPKAFADPPITVCTGGTCNDTTIQSAINAANPGDVIDVSAGTYTENVNVNKNVTINGAGAATTTIVATDGNSTPLTFSTNGATVNGFTLTHDYKPTELSAWNFNNNGVTFNQSTSGDTLENSTVTKSRNAVYVNNAQANIIDNTLTDNRTGLNLTNTIDGTTITGNTISDNWTEGLVYYSQGQATNFSTVTVTGNTFDQNWYEEITIKDAGTSTGTLNVTNNTFTDSPITYTTSADSSLNEPGFAAQIPVEFGGTATKPTSDLPTLRIYDSSGVTLQHTTKTLLVGANEPYKTIQSAINDAAAGDTIKIDAGTYNENLTITTNGLQLVGESEGSVTVVDSGANAYGHAVSVIGANGVGISDMSFSVPANTSPVGFAFQAYQDDGLTLSNLSFTGPGITGKNSNNKPVGGVDVNSSQNVSISNVTSSDFSKNGFSFTAKYAAADTTSSNISLSGITADSDAWAGLVFYTMNGSNTLGSNINGVSFSGSDTLTNDGQGLFVEGDTDANFGASNTPQYGISGTANAPVDLGSTAFSGNTDDVVNYQQNDIEALSATFSGKTGDQMTATEHQAEDALIIDHLDHSAYGLVSYHNSTLPLAAPTNLTPPDGTVTNDPAFSDTWSPVPGAVKYEYQTSNTKVDSTTLGTIIYSDDSTGANYDVTPTLVTRHNNGTPEGNYYWQVRAVDSEGNPGPWSVINEVTVDTTAPVVHVTPVAGSLLHGTETFNITVTDNNPLDSSKNQSVWVYLYDTAGTQKHFGQNVNLSSGSGSFTVDTTLLDDGNANLDVGIVTDAAGNQSGITDNYFTGYTIDNTAPDTPTLLFPANGVYRHTADTNYSKWSSVSDSNGPITYYYESAFDAAFTNIAYGPHAQSATKIFNPGEPEGTYYWRVQACDAVGNCSDWSAPWTINIDNTAPSAIQNVSPSNGADLNTHDFTFDWTDSTDASPVQYNWEASYSSATNADGSFQNTVAAHTLADSNVPSPGTPDGTYYWHVQAVDAAGNTSAWTDTWQVTVDTQAPVTPLTVSLTADSTGASVPNGGTTNSFGATFHWSASAGADHYNYKVWDSIPGNAYNGEANAYTTTVNGTSRDGQFNQGDGTYTIEIQAVDGAGNVSSWSGPFDVTYDSTAPSVSITKPSNNDIVNSTVKVKGKATDINLSKSTWTIRNSAGTVVLKKTNNLSFNWDTTSLPDGKYRINLAAVDAGGNRTATHIFVIVDNTPPTTPVATPGAGNYATSQSVKLKSTDPGDGVADIYYTTDGSKPSQTNGTHYNGAFSVSTSETLKAIAYDNAGNASDVLKAVYTITPVVTPTTIQISNFSVQSATTGNANNNGNTGTGNTQTGNASNNNQAVLGASTTTPNTSSDGQVKGAKTINLKNVSDAKSSNFLSLGWWWLAVLAAIGCFLAFLFRRSDSDKKSA